MRGCTVCVYCSLVVGNCLFFVFVYFVCSRISGIYSERWEEGWGRDWIGFGRGFKLEILSGDEVLSVWRGYFLGILFKRELSEMRIRFYFNLGFIFESL